MPFSSLKLVFAAVAGLFCLMLGYLVFSGDKDSPLPSARESSRSVTGTRQSAGVEGGPIRPKPDRVGSGPAALSPESNVSPGGSTLPPDPLAASNPDAPEKRSDAGSDEDLSSETDDSPSVGGPVLDIAAALSAGLSEADPRKRRDALRDLARRLTPGQFQEALALGNTLSMEDQMSWMPMVLGRMAETDPAGALAYAARFGTGPLADAAKESIASSWARTSPLAAIGWLQSQPPGPTRSRLLSRILDGWARSDPLSAWQYASTSLSPADRPDALSRLAQRIARADPNRAAQLVSSIPPGVGQDNALRSVARSWADLDPNAATAWIDKMPSSTARDAAISGYVKTVAARAPDRAIDMALQVADPGARQRTLVDAVNTWMRYDRDEATAWAQSTPVLTDASKKQIFRHR